MCCSRLDSCRTTYLVPLTTCIFCATAVVSKLPSTGSYCSRKKMTTYTRITSTIWLNWLNKKELYFF